MIFQDSTRVLLCPRPMHVVKPSWVVHPGEDLHKLPQTLYTIAVHPDKSRVATGGLDTKIRVWSTEPVTDEHAEKDEAKSKLLSTMTSHSGASRRLPKSSQTPQPLQSLTLLLGRSRHVCTVVELWDIPRFGIG